MKRRTLFLVATVCLTVGAAVFWFGRTLWHPAQVGTSGAKTVDEVVRELRDREIIEFDPARWSGLILLGLKDERRLEVWGVDRDGETVWLHDFPFTGYSGALGPKLMEGDRQIPEGLYRIEYLNPNSRFHLSMKVDYPNAFDQEKGAADGRDQLGFDIFIHGKSSTIGCIPIGDPNIEKLFLMVAEVGPENVEVILAPYDMRIGKRDLTVAEIDWENELYKKIRATMAAKLPAR